MAVDLRPTEAMAEEAERGLAWREEFGRGGTAVGVARARDISNRVNLSPETIGRMVSYFARHEVDKQGQGWSPDEEGYPSAGRIAWALWGGDPGRSWANARADELEADEGERMTKNLDQRSVESVTVDDDKVTIVFATDVEAAESEDDAEDAAEDMAAPVDEAVAEPPLEEERPKDIFGHEPGDPDYAGPAKRKGPAARMFRTGTIELQPSDADVRRVALAFSSEAEVDRGWGIEVLDHTARAMNMEFIGSGRAPLLLEHDPTEQIGVVESISLGTDRVARAVVRFGKTARAEEILADVKDGIRSSVSVGYMIDEMVLDGVRDGREVYRATSWTPLEISIVSIPADMSVGVGRALEATTISTTSVKETKMSDQNIPAADAAASERSRVSAILELGARHNQRDFAETAVRDGASLEQFRGALLDKVGGKPLATAEIGMSKDEVRSFSFVRALRALSNPTDRKAQNDAAFEFAASEAAAAKEGRASRGITVPADVVFAKRDLTTVTTSGTAKGGNLVATDLLAGSFIDALRNKMVLNSLGATFLTGLQGNVAIPRKTSASSAYWVAENSAPTESTNAPAFDQVTLSPKTIGAYVDFRSEERRVGKECGYQCRSRWSPYH